MSFPKTPAELSETRAPTSSAQPPTTGQPHHHHRHHSQYQMTPAQARPASYASVAAPSGSQQPVVPPSTTSSLAALLAGVNSSVSIQPARRSEAPRSKPAAVFAPYHAPVPLDIDPAPRRTKTGGVGASHDPRLRLAQTATPPIPASPTPPRAATYDSPALLSACSSHVGSSNERVNTVTDTPIFPTPSLEVMETMAGPQRRKRSSNEATGEAKRYCGSRSPPLDNLNGMMSPNIRAAMTGPAPNESRTKQSKEGKYVGSSKTPAESSKLRASTSSAQPPTTGQPHPQYQKTPAQARPASYSCVAAPSGSSQPVVPPSAAVHIAVPPARKNSDPSVQQARRSEYRMNVVPAPPRQPTTGRSANTQTTTPPRDVHVNTVTDTPMFPTPSLENMETMARPQRWKRSSDEATGEAKRYCGSRSPPLDNQNTMMSPNIRAAMTGPAPNESRTKGSKEGKYVGSSKTPAESSKPRAPTSSAQPPTTGQPHPQYQMTPAQARPAYYASFAAPTGSPHPVVPPSVAEHLAVPPARKNSDPSVQPARSSEAPHFEPVSSFATYRTYEIPAPRQRGVGASRDPRLRSANAQTMTSPVPASPASPRAAAYDSSAPLTACSRAGSKVSPGPWRSDVRVNTATDSPMLPTPSLETMKTMARPQLRKWSSDEATGEAKWYCGSRSPLLGNLSRSVSLPNIRAAMTGPAPNESRTKEPKEGQCVGSSKTPAESSKPQAPTSSAQPPTTGQPHPQHQMTPAQARPASAASVVAPSDSRSLNTMDNAGVSCVVPGPQDSELSRKLLDLGFVLAEAIRSMAVAYASRAASGPQDSELSSRKMMDLVSIWAEAFQSMVVAYSSHAASGPQDSELSRKILDLVSILAEAFRSMAVADASHAASGINQFRQLSPYSESNPSEPKKDEKKPLKTKKKPNKKQEALDKKISKHRAEIKECTRKKKELKMSTMKDNANKRLEKIKSLMEKDQEIIKRVDEKLKHLAN